MFVNSQQQISVTFSNKRSCLCQLRVGSMALLILGRGAHRPTVSWLLADISWPCLEQLERITSVPQVSISATDSPDTLPRQCKKSLPLEIRKGSWGLSSNLPSSPLYRILSPKVNQWPNPRRGNFVLSSVGMDSNGERQQSSTENDV